MFLEKKVICLQKKQTDLFFFIRIIVEEECQKKRVYLCKGDIYEEIAMSILDFAFDKNIVVKKHVSTLSEYK